jgi:hypothetical protein
MNLPKPPDAAERNIRELCQIAGRPSMAADFIRLGTPAADVMQRLMAVNSSPATTATMREQGVANHSQPPSSPERPYGSIGLIDVGFADRLPAPSRSMVANFAEDAFDCRSRGLALHHRCLDLNDQIGQANQRLALISDSRYRSRDEETEKKRLAGIEEKRQEIENLRAELLRTGERQRDADGRASIAFRLIESARDLVGRVDRGTEISLFAGPEPSLRKNESAADAVETRRRRIRELAADLDRTRAAPKPSAEMKQQEIARIEFLASQGAPDAFRTIEEGLPIAWPTTSAEIGGQHVSVPDFLAIIAHLNKDQMIAAVTREIDAMADDESALTAAEKIKRIEQIRRDILAIEREEVAFISVANSQGAAILFREGADPRAVFNLTETLPAPRGD